MAKKKLKKTQKPLKPKKVGIEIIDVDDPIVSDASISKFYNNLADEIEQKKISSKKRGRPSKDVPTPKKAEKIMEDIKVPEENKFPTEDSIRSEESDNRNKIDAAQLNVVKMLSDLNIPKHLWSEFIKDLGIYFELTSAFVINDQFGRIFTHKYFKEKAI